MKRFLSVFILLLASTQISTAQIRNDPEIMAARGSGEITFDEFQARIARIPPESRAQVLRNQSRFEDILNRLLIDAQLAADARNAGFHEREEVQRRLKLAMQEELANAWIEHYVDEGQPADYETLAREYYLVNKELYVTAETIDVAHILVNTEDREDGEAQALAKEILAKLERDPDRFTELVEAYSDDAGSRQNGGVYTRVKRGDMVKPFEEAAFALEPGEFSDVIKSPYGYHVIRLDARYRRQQKSFEEVRPRVLQTVRDQHRERRRTEYLSALYGEKLETSKEAIENALLPILDTDEVTSTTPDEGATP